MLNVLLVYYEPTPAGQTTHVLSLARGLDRRRIDVTVVLPEDLRGAVAAFQAAGVHVVPLPLRKIAWPSRTVHSLVSLIRQMPADIVHVHSQEAGLLARLVARAAGARRIIYTPQVLDIRRVRFHWLYILIERALAHITDVIVSVSASDRERLMNWGIPPTKIETIPNGVDLSAHGAANDLGSLRRSVGLDESRPLVMQVGRLSVQKDPMAFVEGTVRVILQRSDAQSALVGEGPLRNTVAARVRELDLVDHVHLLGWRDDASQLMAAADVVTLTSRWEGLPHVLLEAMAWSRPVVATAVNGCPEVVVDGETGFLVEPGDTAGWADRVVELLDDPAKAALMGRRGRERVEERYSLREMVARVEELYLQVAESPG
jgi:glycosyltransferase involved in cell wall biosynthesis